VNQFVDYPSLRTREAAVQLKGYLLNVFNMRFESTSDLEDMLDKAELQKLTDSLAEIKSRQLARDDALLTLAVYGRRDVLGEHATVTEFGLRTWWLTSESKLLRCTDELIRSHMGSRFMMRPEFLLNFLALAPSASEVRTTFANIFPTVLGVKLSKRMNEQVFHGLMKKVHESDEMEPGRRKAQIAVSVDNLKGDFERQYMSGFQE
jgi:hypothetical protein